MSTRSEWIAQLQGTLGELDARIDELEAKARRKEAAATQIETQLVALRDKRDAARNKLSEVAKAGDSAWDQLRDGAGEVWQQITDTLKETKKAFEEGLEKGDEGR